MSVINRVLRDLDQAGEASPAGPGVHVAPVAPATTARNVLRVSIALLGLALAVWLLLPSAPKTPARAVSAPPPVASVAAPPLPAPAETSAPVPARRLQPAAEAALPPAAAPVPAPVPAETAVAPEPRPALRAEARVVKEASAPAPKDPVEEGWRQAGQSLEQGRKQEAREQLRAVLRAAPAHAAARQALIALLIEAGERAEAMRLLDEGRALHPADPWYPRSLAQLHLQAGNPAQAAATLKPALGKASEAGDWALYAGALTKLAHHEEAAAAWREALRGNPNPGAWWVSLGVALEHSGEKADAVQAYQRALQTRLTPELREFAAGKAGE
ncbi:MAG: tetratricopeptide repeat protein [Betaproteobacteria bacterium]|nr:tetratricopeptide repeat protein [Betaproteobacteria bacterium]